MRRRAARTSTPAPRPNWRPLGLFVGLFVAVIVLVVPLGWAITGTLLFAGAATILGSKRYVLNVIIGVVLAVASFYAFYSRGSESRCRRHLDGILCDMENLDWLIRGGSGRRPPRCTCCTP